MDITLESVKRLRLEAGDTLVLRLAEYVDEATLEHLRQDMDSAFPGHKTVVLDGGCELEVVSPQPEG